MKIRTKNYIRRQGALQRMLKFTDINSFLTAGLELSRSVVVKKDILNTLFSLNAPKFSASYPAA